MYNRKCKIFDYNLQPIEVRSKFFHCFGLHKSLKKNSCTLVEFLTIFYYKSRMVFYLVFYKFKCEYSKVSKKYNID